LAALKRVQTNKGAPGVDGMTVDELPAYLREAWPAIREQLLNATYVPSPVREVHLPKPGGGTRMLGIPTVLDRLITQAMLHVMSPIFDPGFSEHSYGFRRGRSAHQAVEQACGYIAEGYRWVVDVDLEKFFDQVNHDLLMSRVARKIKDKRLLKLIRRYLTAGIMREGLVSQREAGTPQGSPLSPLLSNILLDDLDKELERRGHRFCRYADDANVYVRSKRAGERVMASMTHFLESRLRLKVNRAKSAVDRPWKRTFLGYTVTTERSPRLKPAPSSVKRVKDRIRQITHQGRGRNIRRVIAELNQFTRLRFAGPVASPPLAQDFVGAVAEAEDPVSEAGRAGGGGATCAPGHCHRPWGLVECGGFAHARGSEQPVTRGMGSSEPSWSTSDPAAVHLNRRVRFRTHGGVGGRRGQPRLRPDKGQSSVVWLYRLGPARLDWSPGC
jgi:group II intron reverse transcriptase/maturase